jgi:hypothetical protein
MRERTITIPELILVAGTRVALGIGAGLLMSARMARDTRKGAGWALFMVGALSSIPIFLNIAKKPNLIETRAA